MRALALVAATPRLRAILILTYSAELVEAPPRHNSRSHRQEALNTAPNWRLSPASYPKPNAYEGRPYTKPIPFNFDEARY